MAIIYLLLIFILFVVIGVLSMASSIIRGMFGMGSSVFGKKSRNRKSGNDASASETVRPATAYERRGKVFGPHEGEYVEFEEVKENKTE